MKITKRLLALLLVFSTILTFAACKDDEPTTDEPSTDDEFTGSILEDVTPEETPTAPPLIAAGDPEATVEIRTAADLMAITQKGTFILMNDIDMTGVDFKPIGNYQYPFMGTLKSAEGNVFSIKNLKFTVTDEAVGPGVYYCVYAGLFGATNDATVTDIKLENVDITATSDEEYRFVTSGALAGYMINTTVNNVQVSGKIFSKSVFFNAYAAGICGILESGSITDSEANVTIETADSKNRAVSGGIAAYALENATVSGCSVLGSIRAASSYGVAYGAGIIANARHATLTNCQSSADVHAEVYQFKSSEPRGGASYAAGIVAVSGSDNEIYPSSYTRCYTLGGTVTSVGNDNAAYCAGIAAKISYSTFTHCYSKSNVVMKANSAISFAAGGFAKISNTALDGGVADFRIKGCFSYGSLTIEHKNPENAILGNFYAMLIEPNSGKNFITTCVFNQSASFTLNGQTIPAAMLKDNITPKLSQYFTLQHCVSTLGWVESEWETVNDHLIPKA